MSAHYFACREKCDSDVGEGTMNYLSNVVLKKPVLLSIARSVVLYFGGFCVGCAAIDLIQGQDVHFISAERIGALVGLALAFVASLVRTLSDGRKQFEEIKKEIANTKMHTIECRASTSHEV